MLLDEISVIFVWVGLTGMLDKFISMTKTYVSPNYLYIILILTGIYLKL